MRQGRLILADYNWQPPTREPWQSDALCAQTNPDAFFPELGQSSKPAKKLCAECPVREQCLAYALKNGEQFGVWGGLSVAERNALKVGAA